MNIFYLHHDPKICAQMHTDKHCVKMIVEYSQLLSTSHRILDGQETIRLSKTGRKQKWFRLPDDRESILYSATHVNHPSNIWVRKSVDNYVWLSQLLSELCIEYTYRYTKTHKSESSGLLYTLKNNVPYNLPKGEFTQPTPAMPDKYKIVGDSIQSYRSYYINEKRKLFKWKNRSRPEWIY